MSHTPPRVLCEMCTPLPCFFRMSLQPQPPVSPIKMGRKPGFIRNLRCPKSAFWGGRGVMGSKGGSPHLTPPLCPQSGAAEGEEGLRVPRRARVPGVPEQTEAEQRLGVKPPPPCTLFICASPLPARGASLTPGAGPSSCCLRPPSVPLHTRVQPLVALIKSPVLNWSET